jgi:hypothetical protein
MNAPLRTWARSACTNYLVNEPDHIEAITHYGFSPESIIIPGCGDGTEVNAMARAEPHRQFYGIDKNEDYIRVAKAGAPGNAHFDCLEFSSPWVIIGGGGFKYDTAIIAGVFSYIDAHTRGQLLKRLKTKLADKAQILIRVCNRSVWAERLIYRDMTKDCTDEDQAFRIVQLIADVHPSASVRDFGRLLIRHRPLQHHFLWQPSFEPSYDWEVEDTMANFGFDPVHCCTAPFALDNAVGAITDESRWHLYHRG